jgi:uncharacterized protein (DUF1778 family)
METEKVIEDEVEIIEETVKISLPAEQLRKLMDELKENPSEAAKKIEELISKQTQIINL